MRNQGWTQDGELIKDDELYLEDGVLKVKDIKGVVREPTEAESEQSYPEPVRDLAAEIDELKARIDNIKELRQ